MKRIAVISEVHANLPALEAVLEDIHRHSIDTILNLGDFVGYGPFPNEVVKRLAKPEIRNILGNYDHKVLTWNEKKEKWKQTKSPQKWLAFDWAFAHLSNESREFLEGLPQKRRILESNQRILMVHGSPASPNEHLGPDTPDDRLQILGSNTKADIVLCGHSHIPFERRIASTWFVNPGSVGRPDDGDPRASYAILTLDVDHILIQHFRIDYDIDRVVAAIRQAGLPDDFARMVILGKSLNDITEGNGSVDE